jgi:hypothetical protein
LRKVFVAEGKFLDTLLRLTDKLLCAYPKKIDVCEIHTSPGKSKTLFSMGKCLSTAVRRKILVVNYHRVVFVKL